MKRFALFVYSTFYPRGGWRDFKGSYETAKEAEEVFRTRADRFENNLLIVDLATGEIVKEEEQEDPE